MYIIFITTNLRMLSRIVSKPNQISPATTNSEFTLEFLPASLDLVTNGFDFLSRPTLRRSGAPLRLTPSGLCFAFRRIIRRICMMRGGVKVALQQAHDARNDVFGLVQARVHELLDLFEERLCALLRLHPSDACLFCGSIRYKSELKKQLYSRKRPGRFVGSAASLIPRSRR